MQAKLKSILETKINLFAAVLIGCCTSVITNFTSHALFHSSNVRTLDTSALGRAPSLVQAPAIECGQQVYSPIQRSCVGQEIFDAEMQLLFAALGIDAKAYGFQIEENQKVD